MGRTLVGWHPAASNACRLVLVAVAALTAGASGGDPWNKPPEQWNLAEAYRILQDSPWSPARSKIDVSWMQHYIEPQTGRSVDSAIDPAPAVSVLWWSSKTVRLAHQRLRLLQNPAASAEPLRGGDLPDYVVAIEGSEAVSFLRDARQNLEAYLQLPSGTLYLENVRLFQGVAEDEVRAEFHFPRQIEGGPALGFNAGRVVFQCTASAEDPHTGGQNTLSIRAEFEPRRMRAHGHPDL